MAKKTTKTNRANATKTNARKTNVFTARNDREKKMIIAIAALAIALIGSIGTAVAAFSQDLKINGSATVKGTSWDIHFDNLKTVALIGDAEEEATPSIDGASTTIGDYKVNLQTPGDSAEYTFDVVNAGNIDAEITALVIKTGSGLTCSSTGPNAATNAAVCSKLNYTLKNSDGSTVAVGDELDAGATKTMKLKLEFDSSATESDLPDEDVDVSNLGVTITYGQAN